MRGGEPRGRAEGRPRESAARWRRSAEATAGNGRARARWGRLAAAGRRAGDTRRREAGLTLWAPSCHGAARGPGRARWAARWTPVLRRRGPGRNADRSDLRGAGLAGGRRRPAEIPAVARSRGRVAFLRGEARPYGPCPLGDCGDTGEPAHRATALPRPDSPATGTFDPELNLVGVAGDRRGDRDGALVSKLWLLLEENKISLLKQSRSHGKEGGVPKAGTPPPPPGFPT